MRNLQGISEGAPGRSCCSSRVVLPRVGAPGSPGFAGSSLPLSRQVFGPAVASLPGPELPASGLDGPQGGEVNSTGGRVCGESGPRGPTLSERLL